MDIRVPIEVSARHCHLSQKDLENLFGKGYQLKKAKQLNQPSDFAAEEVLDIQVGDKKIENIRIVGPTREATQVEISKTDAIFLGINPPIRLSGDLFDSCGIDLIGPNGQVNLENGLIIALRHIHCSTKEVEDFGFKNSSLVSVKVEGERPITFHNVKIRIRDDYKLCMHIDTDEGNSAGINKTGSGTIL